jgi:hypothetical protein
MTALLSPVFGAGVQLFTNAGLPLNGGKIYTYVAGSLTPASTWNDPSQTTLNANPIILDAYGRSNVQIFLSNGVSYKFIVHDSTDAPVGISYDNIPGIPIIVSQTLQQFNSSGLTPTYIGATSFSVVGNQTTILPAGIRIQATVAAGTAYGTVYTSVFSGGITTLNMVMDSTFLDVGLSAISIGFVSPAGKPIDAYAVTYQDGIQYPSPTVGYGIQQVGWYPEFPPSPSFVSATSFSVPGDFTGAFLVGRRARYSLNSGLCYGTIKSASFGGGITTVGIVPDSTNVDNTIAATAVGGMSLNTAQLDAGQIRFSPLVPYLAGSLGAALAGLPAASVTNGAFAAIDAGTCVYATAGVTVPNSTMATHSVITILNTTGAPITITATIATLRQAGTANTGNRTLAGYGTATIVFLSGVLGIISGQGLT